MTERTTAQRYAASLRELADWYDAHPHLRAPSTQSVLVYLGNTEEPKLELAKFARAMGRADKDQDTDWFTLTCSFGEITLQAYAFREQVCRKVVKGVRHVPAETKVIPAREEEIVEWECDPLLAEAVA